MRTQKSYLLLIWCALGVFGADPIQDFGPESNGMRLKLVIRSAEAPKDEHTFKLTIKNVGLNDRTFISDQLREREDGFPGHIQRSVTFETTPYVLPGGMSTDVHLGKTHSQTIAAGEDWSTQWTVSGRMLSAYEKNWVLMFPVAGHFELRAKLTLTDQSKKTTELVSNFSPIFIGGQKNKPRACAAQIVSSDMSRQNIVLKNVGSEFGSKVGDRFVLSYPKRAYYSIELTEVHAQTAFARMTKEELGFSSPPGIVFQPGDWAGLIAEDVKKE